MFLCELISTHQILTNKLSTSTWCMAGRRRTGRILTQNRRCGQSCRSKEANRRRRRRQRWPAAWQTPAMVARGSASSETAPQTDRPGCQTGSLQDPPEGTGWRLRLVLFGGLILDTVSCTQLVVRVTLYLCSVGQEDGWGQVACDTA